MNKRNELINMRVVFAYGKEYYDGVNYDHEFDSIYAFNSIIDSIETELRDNINIVYKLDNPATDEDIRKIVIHLAKAFNESGKGKVDVIISRPPISPNTTSKSFHTIFNKNNLIVQDVFLLQITLLGCSMRINA